MWRTTARQACQGMVSLETMERIVAAAMDYAEGTCAFGFQGGEPTLAGLDFYRGVLELEERYRKPGVRVCNAIQTNGLCVDEEWARFLAQNHFLVGLSLDGPAEIHNRNRRDTAGKGTFNQVMRAARMLEKAGAEYNILCVVTGQTARSVEQIYRFFRRQGFRWLQCIPCLEPLDQERGRSSITCLPRGMEHFCADCLISGFRICRRESMSASGIWITGSACCWGSRRRRAACRGSCSVQFVVEGDGGVYPCDFYVLDDWRMGTVGRESFAQMEQSEAACRFPGGVPAGSPGLPGVRRVYAVPQRLPPGPAGDAGGPGGPELLLSGLSDVFCAAWTGTASGCGHDSNGTAAVSNQQNQKHGSLRRKRNFRRRLCALGEERMRA